MLINCGITKIWYASGYPDELAMQMLNEADITLELLPLRPHAGWLRAYGPLGRRRMSHPYESFMREAVELAERGRWSAAPNPTVGAVLVRDGVVVARGWHTAYGKSHAEVECLKDAEAKGVDPSACTLVVTLEPCNHQGQTPPCTEAVIAAGIRHVVIGMRDPNPKAGRAAWERLGRSGRGSGSGCMRGAVPGSGRRFSDLADHETPLRHAETRHDAGRPHRHPAPGIPAGSPEKRPAIRCTNSVPTWDGPEARSSSAATRSIPIIHC